ncbi:MAG: aminodeoxychorismate/anthranilate synthase component II [Thermoleophilia bacterium]|nr:aminodeoxychorismate/anthranilate synthase component II [Thermoleophilia bacterium]
MSSAKPRVVMADNRDSFTYNIVQLLAELGADITVLRSDRASADDVAAVEADLICISPGPGAPVSAGCSLDVIRELAGHTPIFGVCLGLQCIGEVFGGAIVRAPVPMHGKVSHINHEGAGCLAGLPDDFRAVRYHSLVIDYPNVPDELEVTATTDDSTLIMAARHRTLAIEGVQFHPLSIMSQHGAQLFRNVLENAAAVIKEPAT